MRMTFYEKLYKALYPLVRRLYRLKVEGAENIPAGGALIASNHTAFSDVIVISAACGMRQVRFMAKKELFSSPIAPLIKTLGAFPVDRGGADVGSIRKTIELLDSGELVGIFPQGHRYGGVDPRTTEIKHGVGMLAYRSGVKVVPVFIDNNRMKTGVFRKNTVKIGKAVDFCELGFVSGGKAEYANAARIIFDRICELKYGKHELIGGADDGKYITLPKHTDAVESENKE